MALPLQCIACQCILSHIAPHAWASHDIELRSRPALRDHTTPRFFRRLRKNGGKLFKNRGNHFFLLLSHYLKAKIVAAAPALSKPNGKGKGIP